MANLRIILTLPFFIFADELNAQNNSEEIQELKRKVENQNSEIQSLRNRLNSETNYLKQKVDNYAPMGLVLFLFGSFCALWAQNTGRNPWAWFFLGLLFSVITVIVLLVNNSNDQQG